MEDIPVDIEQPERPARWLGFHFYEAGAHVHCCSCMEVDTLKAFQFFREPLRIRIPWLHVHSTTYAICYIFFLPIGTVIVRWMGVAWAATEARLLRIDNFLYKIGIVIIG